MLDIIALLPSLVREVGSVDHLVKAFCICPTSAWGASASEYLFLPHDFVLLNPCLPDEVPQIFIPPITDYCFFCKFLAFRGVYLKMTPGFVQDLLQIW